MSMPRSLKKSLIRYQGKRTKSPVFVVDSEGKETGRVAQWISNLSSGLTNKKKKEVSDV